ncbi:phosphoribosylformylglycinamidine cyclo-ligase [Chitinispirillales bacterium ANBcel5]|uniref:phosphoribosylformylglycinamidine cyclo-ligase n=1 Tax=Cellulosispirillum alkaliphilum TaxID=3039283 RepID=UPI002A5389D0|nr:phosphoribosylformylglycinamidine cyclo-ligase [Chitinispirillales bacterium ANBcel5]
MSESLRYSDAGVNIASWNKTKGRIAELVSSTYNGAVEGKFGQFGGMYDISALREMEAPVLVSSTDSVGTKVMIAFESGIRNTVGEDIVNHCVDDILVMGAKPLFFLDYIGIGKLVPETAEQIVEGLARACRANDCVLIGGETAEMPDIYSGEEFDLVGCIVGVADKNNIIDGSTIKPGDALIGLRSNGLHTNGYSLARKIVREVAQKSYSDIFEPTGKTFAQELLRPHRSYIQVHSLMKQKLIKGCAHITGGGFPDNVDRILPADCDALIDTKTWEADQIFTFLQKSGNVENMEMYRTFNMGMGMVLAVASEHVEEVIGSAALEQFNPVRIGSVKAGTGKVVMEF